jgi:hypothetical protein
MNVPIGHERRRRAWFSNIFTRKNNKVAPIVLEKQSSNSSVKKTSADLEIKFEPQDSLKIAKLRLKGKPVSTRKGKLIRSNDRSRISPDMINIKLNPMITNNIGSSKSKLRVSPRVDDFVSLIPRNKGGKTRRRKY